MRERPGRWIIVGTSDGETVQVAVECAGCPGAAAQRDALTKAGLPDAKPLGARAPRPHDATLRHVGRVENRS